jgi:hypothetical protein
MIDDLCQEALILDLPDGEAGGAIKVARSALLGAAIGPAPLPFRSTNELCEAATDQISSAVTTITEEVLNPVKTTLANIKELIEGAFHVSGAVSVSGSLVPNGESSVTFTLNYRLFGVNRPLILTLDTAVVLEIMKDASKAVEILVTQLYTKISAVVQSALADALVAFNTVKDFTNNPLKAIESGIKKFITSLWTLVGACTESSMCKGNGGMDVCDHTITAGKLGVCVKCTTDGKPLLGQADLCCSKAYCDRGWPSISYCGTSKKCEDWGIDGASCATNGECKGVPNLICNAVHKCDECAGQDFHLTAGRAEGDKSICCNGDDYWHGGAAGVSTHYCGTLGNCEKDGHKCCNSDADCHGQYCHKTVATAGYCHSLPANGIPGSASWGACTGCNGCSSSGGPSGGMCICPSSHTAKSSRPYCEPKPTPTISGSSSWWSCSSCGGCFKCGSHCCCPWNKKAKSSSPWCQ